MIDNARLEQLRITIEDLTNHKDAMHLQKNMPTVSETFARLRELLEENPSNVQLWDQATQLSKTVAGALVTETARASLGESNGIAHVSRLLELTNEDTFRIQAFRVLGNACIDFDDNRKRVLDAGAVSMAIPCLKEEQNPELTKFACGFCLNSSMDYDPIQKAIGYHGELMTVTLAARTLENLVREDSVRDAFTSYSGSIERLLDLISYEWRVDQLDNLDLLGSLTDIMIQAVAEDATVQTTVVESRNFSMLLDFVEHAQLPDEDNSDEEEQKKFEEIMTTVTKCVVCAVSSDNKMNELYKDKALLNRFIGWAKSESEVMAQTGVYAIANIARSDEICIDLVKQYHLDEVLLKAFNLTDKATFRYAVLGCLKHLCLPKENKPVIGSHGAIEVVAPLLETNNDMLKRNQFLAIGIIKLLCMNNYDNSEKVIMGQLSSESHKTPLELILACLDRFDDAAAKSEATRVLTNLIKSIWFHPDDASKPLRQNLSRPEVIQPIVEMTRSSNFPVLKNDGIIALTSVFAGWQSDRDAVAEVLSVIIAEPPTSASSENNENGEEQSNPETRSFIEVITGMLDSSSGTPPQMQWNVCVLLENVVQAARGVLRLDVLAKIKSVAYSPLQQITENHTPAEHSAKSTLALLDEELQ
ncbi:armadillo-type protein [Dichotomocladium elegans]|nr:armadillo-type protein [Dichotomocladium elegans]